MQSMTKHTDSDFIVYALTDTELYSALVEDDFGTFVRLLNEGNGGAINKNEFDTREEAEAVGGQLAASGHGIPLFAYDEDNTLYVEEVEKSKFFI